MRFPCGFAIQPYIFVPPSSRPFKLFFISPFPRPRLAPLTFILRGFPARPAVLHIFRTIRTARGEPREIPRSKGSRCFYYSRESRHRHLGSPCEFDQVNTLGISRLIEWYPRPHRTCLCIGPEFSFVARQERFLFFFLPLFLYSITYCLLFLSLLIRAAPLFIGRFRGF